MPNWRLFFHHHPVEPPRGLPREKAARLTALRRLLELLEAQARRDLAAGGSAVQATTLSLTTSMVGCSPPLPHLEPIIEAARGVPVPPPQFGALLDGANLELSQRRFRDLTQLRQYATLRVGTSTTMALAILGVPPHSANPAGKAIGMAATIIALLSTIQDDLADGRNFLPQHLLEDHGLGEADLVEGTKRGQASKLVAQILAIAAEDLTTAQGHLTNLDGDGSQEFVERILENLRRRQGILAQAEGDFSAMRLAPPDQGLLSRLARVFRR